MSSTLPIVAAEILKSLKSRKTTVKTAVYGSNYTNKKQLMSVVAECLKHYEVLGEVLDGCQLQTSDKRLKNNRELAILLLHRHILSPGAGLNGSFSKFKKVVESQKSSIHSSVVRVKMKRKIKDLSEAAVSLSNYPDLPRYIRVNTLVSTQKKVMDALSSDGYKLIASTDIPDQTAGVKWIAVDDHIDNILVLPPKTDLHSNKLVSDGAIILQDKASCMPAFILNPPEGSHVIDACAAPGNKTSHTAAMMANKGSITAYELNKKRSETLKMMLNKAHVKCCRVENSDFTHCDVSKYKNVQYVLVDPSCSGSGISSRSNPLAGDDAPASEERLNKLSSFQSVILKKALSFPNVKKVVYSTCSIHSKENEEVVMDVLEQYKDTFTLEDALLDWPVRGEDLDGKFPRGKLCLRASPETSRTIGFFVALFVRKS